MKIRIRPSFALPLLLAVFAAPLVLPRAAQPRYQLIDLGSLGGKQYYDDFSGATSQSLSSNGTVIGGLGTPDPDPFGDFNGVETSHAFEWKDGILTDLSPAPFGNKANFSQAFCVNSLGRSAGIATYNASSPADGPRYKAVLWKDQQMIELASLGGNQSLAQGINNLDQAVGWALDTVASTEKIWYDYPFSFGAQQRAVLWENGTVRDLGTLGGPCAWAINVNDAGQIIGQSMTATATGGKKQSGDWQWARPVAGFMWQNGTMTDLGNLGGTWVMPWRINQRGQVIGFATRRGDGIFHPFLWENGVIKSLGTLGGSNGRATAINEAGEIVGGANTANGGFHPFLWKDGVMKDLGSLRQASQAWYINNKTQIVGTTGDNDESSNRAFLWENGGPMVDLNTLIPKGSPLTLRFPLGINDAGEILTYGVLKNGDSHPALLLPMPSVSIRTTSNAAGQPSATLDLKVSAGRKYKLESSPDLTTWSAVGDPFVAAEDNLSRELEIGEIYRFFRVVRVF